jgi:hypothetical protein
MRSKSRRRVGKKTSLVKPLTKFENSLLFTGSSNIALSIISSKLAIGPRTTPELT